MEQNKEPRDKLKHLRQLTYAKETELYNREKTVSAISGAGRIEQLHVKE